MKKKKTFKKFLAIVLSLVMCFSFSAIAMAEEVDTPVNDPVIDEMWDSGTYSVPAHTTINTAQFYIPDHHFAFEMSGTGSSSGTYTVKLKTASNSTIVTGNLNINSSAKKDWISVNPGYYYFSITNNTNSTISVTLTYYSWT